MANRKVKGNTYRGAIIDTAPGTSGYFTDAVSASAHNVGKLYYSVVGIFNATVTLQFRLAADPTWTDYGDPITDTDRQIIEDYSNTEWRIGVKSGDYTSGTARVRIDYNNGEDK